MADDLDSPIELQTGANPSAAVIWLHGLGADGHDFAGIVPELRLPAEFKVRFVFPHAPMRPVTINGGLVMRAWYDIAPSASGFIQNETQLAESVRILHGLIERERGRGIEASRIAVAGFSQGGAVALHAALRFSSRLAGAIVLSAPVPCLEELLREADAANTDLPLFIAHGTADPMVPFVLGEGVGARLRHFGRPVEWHAYDVAHGVSLDEIHDIGRFLAVVLG